MYCKEEGDAEHSIFGFDRWFEKKENLEKCVAMELRPDNLIETMLLSENK